jgi:hypothetical protein
MPWQRSGPMFSAQRLRTIPTSSGRVPQQGPNRPRAVFSRVGVDLRIPVKQRIDERRNLRGRQLWFAVHVASTQLVVLFAGRRIIGWPIPVPDGEVIGHDSHFSTAPSLHDLLLRRALRIQLWPANAQVTSQLDASGATVIQLSGAVACHVRATARTPLPSASECSPVSLAAVPAPSRRRPALQARRLRLQVRPSGELRRPSASGWESARPAASSTSHS